jgi:hydroxyacylglutathione hydrolase
MIEIRMLTLGPVQTNCYIVTCDETMHTAVVDPADNGRGLAATIRETGLELTHILLTHAHFDHVGGLAQLKEEYPAVPIYIHPDAEQMLSIAPMQAAMFGLRLPNDMPQPDKMLAEGDVIQLGNLKLDVLYTPGHAPGHISFYNAEHHVLFSGDTLFQGSIGRTDLPGGDMKLLLQMIEEKLLVLPEETQVLSGHGPVTTVGQEKALNPFLQP